MDTFAMRILSINSGSSSIKFAVYEVGAPSGGSMRETLTLQGSLERIGFPLGRFRATDRRGAALVDEQRALPDADVALGVLLGWLRERAMPSPDGVGHRLVHGGRRHTQPELVTPGLLSALRALIPLAPAHLPTELDAIATVSRAYPNVPQVACFDTAFHRSRPLVGQLYALPWSLTEAGVLRYGFHGLSYEYILLELARESVQAVQAGREAAHGRVIHGRVIHGRMIAAHLGHGSSMAAIYEGRSIDATMGFTPLGGLVMSTRSGDLDPGVVLYLLEERRLSTAELRALLGEQSGLLGVSGTSSDMRDLLEREGEDRRAALAVALYCYTARKYLGALVAALGGLDTLIFTAGIGEHAAPIRSRICAGLDLFGIHIDPERNAANAPIISAPGAAVTVRVMPTNEELMIARHTASVLARLRGGDASAPAAPSTTDESAGAKL